MLIFVKFRNLFKTLDVNVKQHHAAMDTRDTSIGWYLSKSQTRHVSLSTQALIINVSITVLWKCTTCYTAPRCDSKSNALVVDAANTVSLLYSSPKTPISRVESGSSFGKVWTRCLQRFVKRLVLTHGDCGHVVEWRTVGLTDSNVDRQSR